MKVPDETGDDHDLAEVDGGVGARNAADALEERRHPKCEPAHGKGVGGVSQDGQNIGPVSHQPAIGRPRVLSNDRHRVSRMTLRRRATGVLHAARRVAQQ